MVNELTQENGNKAQIGLTKDKNGGYLARNLT